MLSQTRSERRSCSSKEKRTGQQRKGQCILLSPKTEHASLSYPQVGEPQQETPSIAPVPGPALQILAPHGAVHGPRVIQAVVADNSEETVPEAVYGAIQGVGKVRQCRRAARVLQLVGHVPQLTDRHNLRGPNCHKRERNMLPYVG